MEAKEALLYEKLSDNKVRCNLCAHRWARVIHWAGITKKVELLVEFSSGQIADYSSEDLTVVRAYLYGKGVYYGREI